MGAIASRQNAGVEEVDISVDHAYRYPPKSGSYFSNHFIMGGERFDTAHPEMYLFGENTDLNFLGSRPAPFPYPAPSASEPSRTLKALVNIRKESLRFVRVPDDSLSLKEPETRSSNIFNIEFTFDCDVRCAITIMYFCTEEVTTTGLIYTPKDASMNSETYHYKKGANQQFSQVCHVFDPSQYNEDNLLYSLDREVLPIVIYCIAEEGEEPLQSHATIAVVEKHSDGYALKPLKQKLFVDGLCYLLQEIYGIENKNADYSKCGAEEDTDDNGAECVICMCDLRDTLILPCRHLCLCNCCADSLRYQANNCPICRAPFRALLQIKALQKTTVVGGANPPAANADGIPAGYEAVSLIEALNGPSVTPQQPVAPPYTNMYVQLPQNAPLDRGFQEPVGSLTEKTGSAGVAAKANALEDSTTQTEKPTSDNSASTVDAMSKSTSGGMQMRLSVLMAQNSEEALTGVPGEVPSPSHSSASSKKKKKSKHLKEDSVICINETSNTNKEFPDMKMSRKSSASSPAFNEAEITETSLCTNDPDDIEELTETLSLLEDLKNVTLVESKLGRGGTSSGIPATIINPSSSISSLSKMDLDGSQNATGGDVKSYMSDPLTNPEDIAFEDGKDFYDIPSVLLVGRGSSKRSKQRNNSGRPGSTSSSRKDRSYSTNNSGEDSTLTGGTQDAQQPQSLPGTPLSSSSAVSRSSDTSMSSASSTRALIVSHPPPNNFEGPN